MKIECNIVYLFLCSCYFLVIKILGLKAGLTIDDFAPRLSFFWGIGMNFYMVSIFFFLNYVKFL